MKVKFGNTEFEINSDSNGNLTLTNAPAGLTFNFNNSNGWNSFEINFQGLTPGATELTFEGIGDSNSFGAYIDNITVVNSSVDSDSNYDTTYIINGDSVAIADIDLEISDGDDTQLESATIVISNAKTGDTLDISAITSASITATLVGNQVNLTGTASLAEYQEAIKAINFRNTTANTDESDRIIEITVNDGEADSNTAITTVQVVSDSLHAIETNTINENNTVGAGDNPDGETLIGGNRPDVITGGDGNDFIDGEENQDTLDGGGGNDTIYGGEGRDQIFGGTGNDFIDGENGIDTIDAGEGDDSVVFDKDDIVDGGSGYDTLIVEDDRIRLDNLENIQNIEEIDLTEDNTELSDLTVENVLDITDEDNELFIKGDSTDQVSVNSEGVDKEWDKVDDGSVDGTVTYKSVTDDATLNIDTNIDIDDT